VKNPLHCPLTFLPKRSTSFKHGHPFQLSALSYCTITNPSSPFTSLPVYEFTNPPTHFALPLFRLFMHANPAKFAIFAFIFSGT
jgi:hypothetical protein